MVQFWQTVMGNKLIEGHLPRAIQAVQDLAKQLSRIADALDVSAGAIERTNPQKVTHKNALLMYEELMENSEQTGGFDSGHALEVMGAMAEALKEERMPAAISRFSAALAKDE